MILHTLELTGSEPTYSELLQRVNSGEFDDILSAREFLMLTTDAGIVKVNTDKSLSKNIVINASDISKEIADAIKSHESAYHNISE